MGRRLPNGGSTITAGACSNPWNPGCREEETILSIRYNNAMHPICGRCWGEIIKARRNWG